MVASRELKAATNPVINFNYLTLPSLLFSSALPVIKRRLHTTILAPRYAKLCVHDEHVS